MDVILFRKSIMYREIFGLVSVLLLAIPINCFASGIVLHPKHCPFPVPGEISNIISRSKVFYVDVFNGPWPIPDRYEVMGSSGGGMVRMVSPPQTCLIGAHVCKKPIGVIRYGKFEKHGGPADVEQIAPKSGVKFSKDAKSVNKVYHGLKIRILTQRLGNNPAPLQTVVIYNNDEYVLIADQNKDLWKCMLVLHHELKAAEKANLSTE